MSARCEAPGLTADWLNGWLAALGATILVPQLTLRWSEDVVPFAIFEGGAADVTAAVADALPREEALDQSVIARQRAGCRDFPRNVPIDTYRERAQVERETHSTHLAASVSDLREDADLANLDHGAFDVPAPRGETLWSRARKAASLLSSDRAQWVRGSFEGVGRRMPFNGLGFDARRLVGSADPSDVYSDPVVELLCYSALALFPTRGDGRRRILERNWTDRASQPRAFVWAAWRPPLDRWAIDAFMDLRDLDERDVVARYGAIPYKPRGDETNRAYFAERLG